MSSKIYNEANVYRKKLDLLIMSHFCFISYEKWVERETYLNYACLSYAGVMRLSCSPTSTDRIETKKKLLLP